jgi:hypothetical protein
MVANIHLAGLKPHRSLMAESPNGGAPRRFYSPQPQADLNEAAAAADASACC